MSALRQLLASIHPEARIVSVETDEHEGHEDDCCDVCDCRIHPVYDTARLIDGEFDSPVAQISIMTPEHDEPEILDSEDGRTKDWPVTCAACVREALEVMREDAKKTPATNKTVSIRAQVIAEIDGEIDNLVFRGVARAYIRALRDGETEMAAAIKMEVGA